MHIIKSISEEEHIEKISSRLAQFINHTVKEKDYAVLAVSGGKSPIPLFKHLSKASLPWDKITIVLVDERVVDANSDDSNENLVKTYLLQNMAKSAKFIALMNKDITNILTQANSTIKEIDIAILGMGADGHTASIFPDCNELDSALDLNNPNTYIITNPLSAKYQRVSLTLRALINTPNLIITINGAEKLDIIEEAFQKNNKNYPISYLINQRSDINIYWQK